MSFLPQSDRRESANRWDNIQDTINRCTTCRPQNLKKAPARPPEPTPNCPLFLTEAPPEGGGFWAATNPPDQVQLNVFSILRDLRQGFKNLQPGRDGLETFAHYFSLIQTLKWPQYDQVSSLKPQARKAIRHSVEAHLIHEIQAIRPTGIFASGAVAGLACCLLAPRSGLCEFFSARGFEEDIAGQRLIAEIPGLGRLPIYFSLLLVNRHRPTSRQHLESFIGELMSHEEDSAVSSAPS